MAQRENSDRAKKDAVMAHMSADDYGYDEAGAEYADDTTAHESTETEYLNEFGEARSGTADNSEVNRGRKANGSPKGRVSPDDVEDAMVVDPKKQAFVANEDPENIERYKALIDEWESGSDVVNNAAKVQELSLQRQEYAKKISAAMQSGDPRLADVRQYFDADIAEINKQDMSGESYFKFIQRRAELRDKIFDEDPDVSPQSYATSAELIQNMLNAKFKIEDQYDLINIRRDVALEHFGNPRFIAEVARLPGELADELLIDFDRRDLMFKDGGDASEQAKARLAYSRELAKLLHVQTHNAPGAGDSLTSKVRAFQGIREMGRNLIHDQRAIILFANNTHDQKSYELGLSALDNKTFNQDVFAEWKKTITSQELRTTVNSKAGIFRLARTKFEKEYEAGRPSMAGSFAVLEQAAKEILANPDLVKEITQHGSADEIECLNLFTREAQREISRVAESHVEEHAYENMRASWTADETSSDPARRENKAASVVSVGEKSFFFSGKLDSGEIYKVDLAAAGGGLVLEAVDGGHVRVSASAADAEAGKFVVVPIAGVMAPPVGTQTRNGALDAGMEGRQHLQGLINRHGVAGMRIRPMIGPSGEQVANISLDSGEDLGQRLLRDGYAVPSASKDNVIRREHLTKLAEANKRGLWRDGFPEIDEGWRREAKAPELSARDKREKVLATANQALAGSPADAKRKLSDPNTRLFGLPVDETVRNTKYDQHLEDLMKRNPTRLLKIYGNNMEILKDLRERKATLTQEEKVAHDILSLGRRAMAGALVKGGYLTPEEARKDGHPLMSRRALSINADALRGIGAGIAAGADKAGKSIKKHAEHGKRLVFNMLNQAME